MGYKQISKQTNKQKLKISISTTRLPTTSQSWFQKSFWNHDWTIFLLRNWQNVRFTKWEKALCKMRKREKTTFQWPKVSKFLTMLPRYRPDFRTGLRFSFRAPEGAFLKWGKAVKVAFSHSQNVCLCLLQHLIFVRLFGFQHSVSCLNLGHPVYWYCVCVLGIYIGRCLGIGKSFWYISGY